MALKKLTLTAYSDEKFTSKVGSYTLQINPESYTHNHSASYNPAQSTDTAGTTTKYSSIEPETVSFSFYLDGTGVVSDLKLGNSIKHFKQLAYQYNGDIHSPNYLLLVWGSLSFKCRMTKLDVEYTLFDPDGMPLRAKLTPSFQQFLSADDLAKLSGKNSPDMTHLRYAGAGDTLPLMCQRIYGDSRHYLMVANYNGLSQFRNLQPGQAIVFPPLKAS
ncbi:LysM peptidoglycan-binding domain-containing protein [Trinickia terrae]|uniref:LysM peptidoglycan-binding domain-containing protein n=1 Tax=Trinickia terrae TaxID=2571161 RepID=A0A4U1I6A1_9BURK|nr:LysM peptidoglycan-binding domain-containing protein [Trinickia terrae]TKC88725.1 LysM peptidoglycan-binding domain-containing protein [Trinickia terrae]